jgi:hypothetical protein
MAIKSLQRTANGPGISALIKREGTLLSDYFLSRYCRVFSNGFATLTRTCVFVAVSL